jgi:hypothetical protein
VSLPYFDTTKIIHFWINPNKIIFIIKININAGYKELSRDEKHIIRQ